MQTGPQPVTQNPVNKFHEYPLVRTLKVSVSEIVFYSLFRTKAFENHVLYSSKLVQKSMPITSSLHSNRLTDNTQQKQDFAGDITQS